MARTRDTSDIRIDTVRHGDDYYGRITGYDCGRRVWSQQSPIRRLSRVDATHDAQDLARTVIIHQWEQDT